MTNHYLGIRLSASACLKIENFKKLKDFFLVRGHCSALVGSDPHELKPEFEVVCQMKGTHIGVSELTCFKSYEIDILSIRPLCFWSIRLSPKCD